jgi:hypothetical protein
MNNAPFPLSRRLLAEAVGTAILVATVVGSGIMAERLAGGNQAVALLGNTIPTGAILVVIITILGPISGLISIRQSLWSSAAGASFRGARSLPMSSFNAWAASAAQ